jgi:hypothetical protein
VRRRFSAYRPVFEELNRQRPSCSCIRRQRPAVGHCRRMLRRSLRRFRRTRRARSPIFSSPVHSRRFRTSTSSSRMPETVPMVGDRIRQYAAKTLSERVPKGLEYELGRLYYDIAGTAFRPTRPSSARSFSSWGFNLADPRARRVRARRCTLSTRAASTAWLRLRKRRRATSSSTRSSNALSSVRATFVLGMTQYAQNSRSALTISLSVKNRRVLARGLGATVHQRWGSISRLAGTISGTILGTIGFP